MTRGVTRGVTPGLTPVRDPGATLGHRREERVSPGEPQGAASNGTDKARVSHLTLLPPRRVEARRDVLRSLRGLARSLVLVLALGALSACTAPAPEGDESLSTVSVAREDGFLTLGAGDLVVVDVLRHPELSTSEEGQRIDPQGKLYLPMVGAVDVAGLTLGELNRELAEAYRLYMHEPVVTASILAYASRTFHLLGNLTHPGTKTMERPLNALEALAQGGPFRPGADRESAFLLRPHGDRLEVHRFNAATPGVDGLVQVLPGDILFVRQKGTQDLQEDLVPILAAFGLNAFVYTALDD